MLPPHTYTFSASSRLFQRLEPWAWACTFICLQLVAWLVIPLPLYVSAILLAGLGVGPLVSLSRRTLRSALLGSIIGAIEFAHSYRFFYLPEFADLILIDTLLGVLWWSIGQAFAGIRPQRVWAAVVCWSYRWFGIASLAAAGFLILCILKVGCVNTLLQLAHTLALINGLVVLSTLPLQFALPSVDDRLARRASNMP